MSSNVFICHEDIVGRGIRFVVPSRSGAARLSEPTVESALRYLATRNHEHPLDLLQSAIERPQGDVGSFVTPLTSATSVLDTWTPDERARALWSLIQECIRDRDVAPTDNSRRRRVLHAAFRLPDSGVTGPWKGSLHQRFEQLKTLTEVFGGPITTQPMEAAWSSAVKSLSAVLQRRLAEHATPEDWQAFRPTTQRPRRTPDTRADPIYLNYMVTTVFLKGRVFTRRITERVITAMEDGVDRYVMRNRPPLQSGRPGVIITNAWGCEVQRLAHEPHSETLAHLVFPSLSRGETHWFATELVADEEALDDRPWVNVPVNNHGIAPGQVTPAGIPVQGLTVRLVYDPAVAPTVAWFYTDEMDRKTPPPASDPRRLPIRHGMISHTFAEACEPRDQVGIAFRWE